MGITGAEIAMIMILATIMMTIMISVARRWSPAHAAGAVAGYPPPYCGAPPW